MHVCIQLLWKQMVLLLHKTVRHLTGLAIASHSQALWNLKRQRAAQLQQTIHYLPRTTH